RARRTPISSTTPRQIAGPAATESCGVSLVARGYGKPLYVLPFDHRASFETGMFGWKGALNVEQTAQIAAAKRVIYDSFVAAIAGGIPKDVAGILVDEQFGGALLREAA